MTHQDIDAGDIIDRYVRGKLEPEVREAFEEHFFACDACFASVREVECLRGAVSEAVRTNALPASPESSGRIVSSALIWLPLAASLVLATGLAWVVVRTVPQLQSELASTRADRDVLQARQVLAAVPTAPAPAANTPVAEANVPIVMLQSERSAGTDLPSTTIPTSASHLIVWINGPASSSAVRLVVQTADGRDVIALDRVARNSDGAYVISVPAALLPPRTYRLRLLGGRAGSSLLGEYLLRVDPPKERR